MKEGIPTENTTTKAEKQKNQPRNFTSFKSVIAGDVFSSEKVEKHAFYMLFVILLVIFYIGNGYHAYTLEKQNKRLEQEIKELRAEFVSTQAVLIEKMKYANIYKQIQAQEIDLQELKNPPYTISKDGH
jgi:cell division protein FtsL